MLKYFSTKSISRFGLARRERHGLTHTSRSKLFLIAKVGKLIP